MEKSLPSGDFEPIGVLAAAGNTTTLRRYNFVDRQPALGENIYRIKETDQDGATTLSSAISVTYGESDDLIIVKAPAFESDQLVFDLKSTRDQFATAELYDMQGRVLLAESPQLTTGTSSFRYSISSLSSGIYLLQLKTAMTQTTFKLRFH